MINRLTKTFFRLSQKYLTNLLAVSCFIFLKLLTPVLKIRFTDIYSERLGHLALDFDIYFSGLKQQRKKNEYVMFFVQQKVANTYLLDLIKQQLKPRVLSPTVARFCRKLLSTNAKYHFIQDLYLPLPRTDILACTTKTPALIRVDPHVAAECAKKLIHYGIEKEFVCFHNRDQAYEKVMDFRGRGDPNIHDYRNSDVTSFFLVADELSNRGHSIVRLGKYAEQRAKRESIKLDYPFEPELQNDQMDVYLCAKARFTIFTTTGIINLAGIFRTPQVIVNVIPFTCYVLKGLTKESIVIPKLLWHEESKRFLTFSEMLKLEINVHNVGCPYAALGLIPKDNEPEDIRDAALEMDDMLKGNLRTDTSEEVLQQRFWNLTHLNNGWHTVRKDFRHRIATAFLLKHEDLLK